MFILFKFFYFHSGTKTWTSSCMREPRHRRGQRSYRPLLGRPNEEEEEGGVSPTLWSIRFCVPFRFVWTKPNRFKSRPAARRKFTLH